MLPFTRVSRTAPEKELLTGTLDELRALILWKLEGVSEEQAVQSTVPSATTLLGIVKHLAFVERWWFHEVVGGASPEYPWSEEDPDADWRIEPGETIESISRLYVDAVAESNAFIARESELSSTRDVRGNERSVRWVIAHMIDETARHAGQADIIRELIDGTTGYVPGD